MNTTRFRSFLTIAISFCFFTTTGFAGTITFNTNANDLNGGSAGGSNGAFGIPNNQTSTVSGVTLTVTATGSTNAGEPIGVNGGSNGTLLGDGDAPTMGIGVVGDGNWQLDGGAAVDEQLQFTFDQAVELCSIDLNGIGTTGSNNDRAIVSIPSLGIVFDLWDVGFIGSTALAPNQSANIPTGSSFSGGATDVLTFPSGIVLPAGSTISFTGVGAGTGSFSLRNIVVAPVPEPALPVLSIAIGLLFLRRRS